MNPAKAHTEVVAHLLECLEELADWKDDKGLHPGGRIVRIARACAITNYLEMDKIVTRAAMEFVRREKISG